MRSSFRLRRTRSQLMSELPKVGPSRKFWCAFSCRHVACMMSIDVYRAPRMTRLSSVVQSTAWCKHQHLWINHLSVPSQVKEDETVTVGQVLAKIAAGDASSQPAGQASKDPKQEDAAAGAAPADSTAVDTESQKDSGMPMTDSCPNKEELSE